MCNAIQNSEKNHGGKRAGSGPKQSPGPYGEGTKVMRIPISRINDVRRYLSRAEVMRAGKEVEILGQGYWPDVKTRLPIFASSVSAGFPSPAEDYAEGRLDLNEYLVEHEAATFYVRVKGHSMTGAGILDGDVIAVDKSLEARSGDIVVAVVDNELTVKELSLQGDAIRLLPHNPDFTPTIFKPGQELMIWGVVKGVVRKLR